MPVHDWTRVEAGIFHAFHVAWIPEMQKALNGGLLPEGYYALAEQHARRMIADILTLHTGPQTRDTSGPPATGGTAVAEAPPKVSRHLTLPQGRRRTLAIRHVSGHRLVAMIEIVSPGNKDRPLSVQDFAEKAASALDAGVHLLVLDLFPPGPHDPRGMHARIWQELNSSEEPDDLPSSKPLALVSYSAAQQVDAYLEHLAPGAALPEMPLFIHPERYVNVPLESTYLAAYRGMPAYWRDVLEGRAAK